MTKTKARIPPDRQRIVRKNHADDPLQVKITRDRLVISIGVGTLAYCAAHDEGPLAEDFAEGSLKIVDQKVFAKDVMYELGRETETGATPLTRLLDQVEQRAIEEASLGVAFRDGR